MFYTVPINNQLISLLKMHGVYTVSEKMTIHELSNNSWQLTDNSPPLQTIRNQPKIGELWATRQNRLCWPSSSSFSRSICSEVLVLPFPPSMTLSAARSCFLPPRQPISGDKR